MSERQLELALVEPNVANEDPSEASGGVVGGGLPGGVPGEVGGGLPGGVPGEAAPAELSVPATADFVSPGLRAELRRQRHRRRSARLRTQEAGIEIEEEAGNQ